MTALENSGRWLFVFLAGLGGFLALKLLVSHFNDPSVSRNVVPRVVWIVAYLGAAVGVAQWKPWAYLLGILVCAASLFYGVKNFGVSSHRGADIFSLILWFACLVWLWLPGVRGKFKPVTA
jgi:hypothetical protein